MRPVFYLWLLLLILSLAGFAGLFWGESSPRPPRRVPAPQGPVREEPRQNTGVSIQAAFACPDFVSTATIAELEAQAKRVVDQLVAAYPDRAQALNVSAMKHAGFGDWDQAVQVWRRCLELDPRFTEALLGKGRVALQQDEYEQDIQVLRRALQLVPEEPLVSLGLAEALMKSGSSEEALQVLEDHVESPRATVEAHSKLGQVHFQLEQYEPARKHFEIAVQSKPELRAAWYGLARLHAVEGDQERAEQCLERFQALAEREREADVQEIRETTDRAHVSWYVAFLHNAVAEVYDSGGDLRKAEKIWCKAAALDPQDLESRTRLLALYRRSARYGQALALGRQLVELAPENVNYWLELGRINARLHRREQAAAAVRRAIELDPNHPKVREIDEFLQYLR